MYSNFTDEELVTLAKQGDENAEEQLIRKYKDVVRLKAHHYFIMGADTEDVIQEGMIGVFKAIKSFDARKDTSFETFVELCIIRQIITAIKRANRLKHSPLNTSVSLSRPVGENQKLQTIFETLRSGSDDEPENLIILKEIVNTINTDGQKTFSKFELQVWNEYIKGKNYLKIAAELNKTPKAIDNAIQRIKKKVLVYF